MVRILSIENLRKQRVLVVDWYCKCKRSGESIDHLLLHCPVAQEIWWLIFSLFGVQWVYNTILALGTCYKERRCNTLCSF